MNIDDLRDELQQLAGPVPRATSSARAAVGERVRRGRRRRNLMSGGASVLAALLVVAIVAVGLHSSNDSVNVRTTAPSATTTAPADPQCALGVKTVPPAQVPPAVAAWVHGLAVVGGGRLWTARRSIAVGAIHDGSIYRLKIGWFATPFGIPSITARRLDAIGHAVGDANEAIDGRGKWVVSTIELPAAGCWQITAKLGSSTIVFRRLVGDPSRTVATGIVAGRLVGAFGLEAPRGLTGTITIREAGIATPIWVGPTIADGSFSVALPQGRYLVTATSPHYQAGEATCRAAQPLLVVRGHTTPVTVTCDGM
jgi:hypothetical protein